MHGFLTLANTLLDFRREVVILQVSQAMVDDFAQVIRFGASSAGRQKVEALLGFGSQANGSGHVKASFCNTYIHCITTHRALPRGVTGSSRRRDARDGDLKDA